ncbi:MAG: polyribonucleotide nucleotidyltransferase [Lachnospirales bacterium]
MYKTYEFEIANRKMTVEIGRVAELANASALIRYGDTVVLAAVTASEKPRDGIDFFPLSIDYEEKLYSVGKIPGGFLKREGRASEKATLTARLIDRPMRPLFPKDYRNDVGIVTTVLSVDQDASPEICAMIGAAIVLSISDIPFNGPVGSTNIGLINGNFIINPTNEEKTISDLDLTVSSTAKKVMMIEAGANEVSNDTMYEAIMLAHDENKKIVEFINGIVAKEGKEKHSYEQSTVDMDVYNKMKELVSDQQMEEAVFTDMKQERDAKISALKNEVIEKMLSSEIEDENEYISKINEAIYKFQKETVRRMILRDNKRPDGRALNQIRELAAEIDILPRTHGSAIFKRGQTQVMTIATLGAISEAQKLDGLDEVENKRYMHHYNFPSYSVGETRPSRGPGRREIGHGALAERALVPVLPSEDEFSYAIRLVSEVVSSNGSTSQASVCGSSLALMDAGVPIKGAVAGISVGLVTGDSDDDFVLLTDIQGLEDFFGDMDFKVAGTKDGITAIQMDIKIDGLTPEIIQQSLSQTFGARMYILDEIMNKAIAEPKKEVSKYAPKIETLQIDVDKIAELIGPRGKTIKRILEETGVEKIDTEDSGRVSIVDSDSEKINKAKEMIVAITSVPEIGAKFKGTVVKTTTFGAFVEYAPGKEGLVHISQIDKERIKQVEDKVNVGDVVDVKVIELDDQGRIKLSIKACFE